MKTVSSSNTKSLIPHGRRYFQLSLLPKRMLLVLLIMISSQQSTLVVAETLSTSRRGPPASHITGMTSLWIAGCSLMLIVAPVTAIKCTDTTSTIDPCSGVLDLDKIEDGSCNSNLACYKSTSQIGENSCNDGSSACYNSKGEIGSNSCIGGGSCSESESKIGSYSCLVLNACRDTAGTIGTESCDGINACRNSKDEIGDKSCVGALACTTLPVGLTVGDNACNGNYACSNPFTNTAANTVENTCTDPKGDQTSVGNDECNVDEDGDRTCCTHECDDANPCNADYTVPTTDARDIFCGNVNACFCNSNGRCQKNTGGAVMDPHFETLTGQKFDFQGECDLILFRSGDNSNGVGMKKANREDEGDILNVHIRTTIRDYFSYIERVGIQIGKNTVVVDNDGMCLINNVIFDTAPRRSTVSDISSNNTVRGALKTSVNSSSSSIITLVEAEGHENPFAVTVEHVGNGPAGPKNKFTVTTGPHGEALTIVVWDVFVSVTVTPAFHARWSNNGLSSSSTMTEGGMIARDMLDRQGVSRILDGTTMMDPSEWAREWQVRPDEDPVLFDTPRAPQYPEACVMPDPAVIAERHLANSALTEMANEACAHWGPPSKVKKCMYDVVATGNIGLAAAF